MADLAGKANWHITLIVVINTPWWSGAMCRISYQKMSSVRVGFELGNFRSEVRLGHSDSTRYICINISALASV